MDSLELQPPPLTLDAVARPSGCLAMVAMDQRESLRTMFVAAGMPSVTAQVLVDFKRTVAHVLSLEVSGFLIDREYGYPQVRDEKWIAPHTGLIVAADILRQEPLGPVEDTAIDASVLADDFDLHGVAGLKLLIIWRRDARREARLELAKEFVERCASRGVLSVLEPVVRPTAQEQEGGSWNLEEAIGEAAGELSRVGQDLYKVQVPLGGKQPGPVLDAACRALNRQISGPWVVLSQGVATEDYVGAVEAACRAGASGFLAGRAIWADLVGRTDLASALAAVAVPRLRQLCEVVDREATPWWKKTR